MWLDKFYFTLLVSVVLLTVFKLMFHKSRKYIKMYKSIFFLVIW